MRIILVSALLLVAAGCDWPPPLDGEDGGSTTVTDSGIDSGTQSDAGVSGTAPLGLNDVTMLIPLPSGSAPAIIARATDLASDGTALIPQALFTQVSSADGGMSDIVEPLSDFQLVAVRFDLCDRALPGPCPTTEDGRFRAVFQPVSSTGSTSDVAIHAFYVVPNADLATVTAELRDLAALQNTPTTSALTISPALTADRSGAYATKLRALFLRYGGTNKLFRLTFFAQPSMFAAIRWFFRGVERQNGDFVRIDIPDIGAQTQSVLLLGQGSYDVSPTANNPAGLPLTFSSQSFVGAAPGAKTQALEALAQVENPLTNTAGTVQCVSCHVSTFLIRDRSNLAGVNPASITGRYTSTYDLSIAAGRSGINPNLLRGLGYFNTLPVISQRVANETAQTLSELNSRFPAAQP